MPDRFLLATIPLIVAAPLAAAPLVAAPLAGQVAPRDAAKAFTLDSVAPTPAPEATSTPTPTPTPAPEPTPAPIADAPAPIADAPAPADPAPAAPSPAIAAPALPDSAAATAPAIRAVFTLDTPIQDLIADPGAKAVLDKDLPGVSDDDNLDKFKALSLRSFQPMTGGQLTDAMLAKVASDLDVLAGGSGTVNAPIKAGNAKRGKDDSR